MPSLTTLLQTFASLQETFKAFGVEVLLATAIFLHYRRFGMALSSKQSFGPVLPFVALTTFLIISVVQSSFTLSLGLVGALSIVRFRTPVKDPEELAYIFLGIASGVGAAGGRLTLTVTVVLLILLLMTVMRRTGWIHKQSVFLSIDVANVTDVEAAFGTVSSIVQSHATRSAFIRYEMQDAILHLTAEAELAEPSTMSRITSQIRAHYPSTNVSFYDESNLPTP